MCNQVNRKIDPVGCLDYFRFMRFTMLNIRPKDENGATSLCVHCTLYRSNLQYLIWYSLGKHRIYSASVFQLERKTNPFSMKYEKFHRTSLKRTEIFTLWIYVDHLFTIGKQNFAIHQIYLQIQSTSIAPKKLYFPKTYLHVNRSLFHKQTRVLLSNLMVIMALQPLRTLLLDL